ncbi:23 kDa integral membrane protein-like [Ceratina calcarata]|uniref:Tetraspanin n=1 Tax=Ceratina calcarata TaxID=156304 RepID=A0AAJ7N8A5_9HYME|nr:23 kDa integral membrane protein-like [Ceratina calcarata]
MGCGMGMIKYLLFIFNFIFAVCGLAILTLGVMVHLKIAEVQHQLDTSLQFPAITLIVIGSIVFVVSFFGCCGAIRESHCMTITFASFLLFILLVQVAVAVFAFMAVKNNGNVETKYRDVFNHYRDSEESSKIVDLIQSSLHCCGLESPRDFNFNIPGSCCGKQGNETCPSDEIAQKGCTDAIKEAIHLAGTVLGGVAIGVAGVELIGIIFALCLANSIRNSERRGYRV